MESTGLESSSLPIGSLSVTREHRTLHLPLGVWKAKRLHIENKRQH